MPGREGLQAREYHQLTKHSVEGVMRSGFVPSQTNRPYPYKEYPGAQYISLPEDLESTGVPALKALESTPWQADRERIPTLAEVATLLYYTAGITKKLVFGDGDEFHFRAAPGAGAKYPIEVYLVCGELDGIEAGVYHFHPARYALAKLRDGDWRGYLHRLSGGEKALSQAPAALFFSAITYKSAHKYRTRSYRYHFWDLGVMLANALASAAALDLPTRVVMGFVDAMADRLLGLDGEDEKSLCLMPVGSGAEVPEAQEPPELTLDASPIAPEPLVDPQIERMHRASLLESPEAAAEWRGPFAGKDLPPAQGQTFPLRSIPEDQYPTDSTGEVIRRRGSSRQYYHEPVSFEQASLVLEKAISWFPACWLSADGPLLNDLYVNALAVKGLPPGAYSYRRDERALELLQQGDLRGVSAHLALGQNLGGDAAFTGFFLADLEPILRRYGNRGYRLAQLEAGVLGGRMYLAAYALGLGASGLTFYDDDVIRFFSPHAAGKDAIFITTVGVPAPPLHRMGRLERVHPGEPLNPRARGA